MDYAKLEEEQLLSGVGSLLKRVASRNKELDLGKLDDLIREAEDPAPEKAVECEHESDGYVYEEHSKKILTMCKKCGVHYYIPRKIFYKHYANADTREEGSGDDL